MAESSGRRSSSLLRVLASALGAVLVALAVLLLPQALGGGEQDSPRLLYALVALAYAVPGCFFLRIGLKRGARH